MPSWDEQQEPLHEEVEETLPTFEPANSWMAREYHEPGWVLPNLIPAESSGAIVAPSYTGKTLLAIRLLIETARLGFPCGYVMEEGTAFDFKARLQAAGLEEYLLDLVCISFQQGARLDDKRWLKHLEGQLAGMAVCFFDTFADVTEVDPIDAKRVAGVFKGIRALRIATGCSLCVVMHTPKAIFRNETPPSLADVFGSVQAVNVLDFIHLLRPLEVKAQTQDDFDGQELADAAARRMSEGRIEVHTRKLRGAALPPTRVGQIVKAEVANGHTYPSAHFQWVEGFTVPQAKQAARVEAVRMAVLHYCAKVDCPSANKVTVGLKGWRKQDVLQAVRDLLTTGQLIRDSMGNMLPLGLASVGVVVPGSAGSQVVPELLGTKPAQSTGGVVPGPIFLGPEPPQCTEIGTPTHTESPTKKPVLQVVVPALVPSEDVEEKPVLHPVLTCLTVANGTRCDQPVDGLGVWCRVHKAAVMKGST